MHTHRHTLVIAALALLASQTWAQGSGERRAAAEQWLSRSEIKIHYVGPYESKFTVDLKDKTTMFYNSPDRFCASRPVPTDMSITDDGMLQFAFNFKGPGCMQIRYTFDPITKVGVSQGRDAGSPQDAPWRTSTSKIALLD